MRDMKFRAFSFGSMRYFAKPEDFEWFFGGNQGPERTLTECKLMQFTGLYDKNGKEIYEGDHIRVFGFITNPRTKDKIPYNATATVKYGENIACFLYLVDDSNVWSNFRYTKSDGLDYEVIGNIYENPELLKEVE